jgi:putative heme-binding domain-containing protein
MSVDFVFAIRSLATRAIGPAAAGGLAMLALALGFAAPAWAQRELKVIPDPDPALELKSFQVADGLEVNLYAADPLLAKPIHINFDAQGRLWVASSEVYPHVKPGQQANDKILVLEDADGDGRAEKTTVFAGGLLIPTGIEPGDGGVYVANSTELLHFKDTDNDGKADVRRVVLSGFGTEDTHHILHTLRWGNDGMLYFNQSIYIHSHIETPHGVRHLNSGGIWQLRPETMQLEVFARGLCNPWGHIFDRWGQSFATDGAGGEGINYVFPGVTMFTYAGATKVSPGLNPGSPKHCGLETISGRHFPEDWQGSLVTNDFRAHRVCRFVLSETGSGYSSREQTEIIKTSHGAFRPIDAKMGPDGALYIADWYNPIIQHGEVDFRDERRDHTHGRIWRVTFKGRPLAERPKLVGASIESLLALLREPEDFTRLHAKLQLKGRGAAVVPVLAQWTQGLDTADPQFEHLRLDALWTYQSLDVVEPQLLTALLQSPDHHVRAAATRVLSAWHARVPQAASLLAVQVADAHPQVRLEAVRALAELRTATAAEVAMRALDQPMDRFLDHALWLAARDLEPYWLPSLESGKLSFGGSTSHLTFALQSVGSPGVLRPLMQLLRDGKLPADRQEGVLLLVASLGGPPELRLLFDMAMEPNTAPNQRAELLAALVRATRMRKVQPEGDLGRLHAALLEDAEPGVRAATIEAAGLWKIEPCREIVRKLAADGETTDEVRRTALDALAAMGNNEPALVELCKAPQPYKVRAMAIAALATLDVKAAAHECLALLQAEPAAEDPAPMIVAILDRKAGAAALAEALSGARLPPDAAKLAVRAVRSSAREEPALVTAFNTAGGIAGTARALSTAEMSELVAEVAAKGNAERGEAIFRRNEQSCLKCHAIAGSGGRVGPDLVSIGASAQVDYLIESILQPSAKIKENYHGLTVVSDGRVLSGVKVRETAQELVLRDVEDRELTVPVDSIEERKESGSIMPLGLADTLTHGELVDLVRFLSELGKVGPYATSKARVVRRWQALHQSRPAVRVLNNTDEAPADAEGFVWSNAYSQVSGSLPTAALPSITGANGRRRVVRCQLDAATAGQIELLIAGPVEKMWLDAKPVAAGSKVAVDLPAGVHTLTLVLDAKSADDLRLELADVVGSAAQVQIVGGK